MSGQFSHFRYHGAKRARNFAFQETDNNLVVTEHQKNRHNEAFFRHLRDHITDLEQATSPIEVPDEFNVETLDRAHALNAGLDRDTKMHK